ncbi:hypothetical protein [Dyadobacter sp. CY356]|uniref:hypothetical protein n=1 Tax=Dyadobacter sp. CY356 TaxID=2906442 RepID=UPI001F1EE04F|nr:hypothetical protein [Dyadobacter sp. CY356]MCF0056927.1 hypothetical protein [Dyadobacter sp. CY356]
MPKSIILAIVFLICLSVVSVKAQDTWPKEIPYAGGGTIAIYQLQPEKLSGDNVTARAAVSIRKKSGDEPVFGAMWIQGQLSAGNNATLKNVTVRQSKFADNDNIDTDNFRKSVEQGFSNLRVQFSRDDIQAAINQEQSAENLKNDAPLIIYRDKPTTLIVLDGEPVEERDDDLQMIRVVNTPYLIVKNPDDNKYYLYGGSFWYTSNRVKDGWGYVKNIPSRIKSVDAKMNEEEKKASSENDDIYKFTTPTDILVVTEPAEIIQTEGKPTYQAVQGSTLLYVNNSLDEIFKDIDSQKNYILIAGRWYNSTSLNGPWQYVPQNSLPPAFANIPAGSEKDGVLASVAGTEEADDALMEAQIPQTAKVDRSTARVEVNYDGEPRFVPIQGTNLSVAENADITVMQAANNQFYALENGIWFISNNPYGPWQVANERPSDVDRIPPSNAAYNARYVYIYETTPQYVYVGYTQGYMGNYIYGPTVVWGTGWHYRPWRGRYYRPRPVTWGFGMHYNPWAGWSMSFGLGFNVGWYHYGRSRPNYGGWFGPPAYRPPYRPWGWNGGYYGSRPGNGGYTNRPRPNMTINRPVNGNRNGRPDYGNNNNNLYRDRKSVVATRDNVFRPAVVRPNSGRTNVTRPVTGNDQNGRPGNGRPSTGSGQTTFPDRTRPSTGNGQNTGRPDLTRPSTGRDQNTIPDRTRPTIGNGQNSRPNITQPSTGSSPDRTRPSIGNGQNARPDISRPANGSDLNARPNISRPINRPDQPVRQSFPQNNRENARPSVTPNQNRAPQNRQPAANPNPQRNASPRANPRGREQ